jgi:hypothetical protein
MLQSSYSSVPGDYAQLLRVSLLTDQVTWLWQQWEEKLMLVDPEVCWAALEARAKAVADWDLDADPEAAHLQIDIITACLLARKLVEEGHMSDRRGVKLTKCHPRRGGDATDLHDLDAYWDLNYQRSWEKPIRFVWGNLIHCEIFAAAVEPNGVFFAGRPILERSFTGTPEARPIDTLCCVTIDELLRSWREE